MQFFNFKQIVEKAKGGVEYAKEKVSEGMETISDKAQKGAEYLKHKTGETIESVSEKTKELTEKMKGETSKEKSEEPKVTTLFERIKQKFGFGYVYLSVCLHFHIV
jgi:hypothetical protein